MPEEKVRDLADGRVYSGEQAKAVGLVDVLGNMEDAIDLAAKRGGITGMPRVVYAQMRAKSWWERLLFSLFSGGLEKGEGWGLRYQVSLFLSHS